MICIILSNGEYGESEIYREYIKKADKIICADGGANQAYKMGIIPDYIIGDMDSIKAEIKEYFLQNQVTFKKFPRRKDFTDTQLALSLAEDIGAREIIFLGTMGKRLDHALSNLYCSIDTVLRGIKVTHITPEYKIYLINRTQEIEGQKGDLVSVFSLSDFAYGVSEAGFEYPLENVVMENKKPYGVSNVLTDRKGIISVEEGILAVFHYYNNY